MRKRSSVNVNILTHLEFERVYHLVTKEKFTVKQAKRKAQREILNFFAIKLDSNADAEDMDVFGSTDADAALLAISILLQGDRTESDMMALLSEMSTAMAEDSVWDDDRAKAIKAEMADWAFGQNLAQFRKNVEDWGLNDGSPVGDFEKFINNFIAHIYHIDSCLTVNDPVQTVDNPLSFFHGRSLHCYKDTAYGVHPNYTTRVTWVEKRTNPYLNEDIQYGEMVDWRNRRLYNTTTVSVISGYSLTMPLYSYNEVWMAEDLDFEYRVKGAIYGNIETSFGREYTWAAAMDSAGVYSAAGAGCGDRKTCSANGRVRGVCPEGWYLPSDSDWVKLINTVEDLYGETYCDEEFVEEPEVLDDGLLFYETAEDEIEIESDDKEIAGDSEYGDVVATLQCGDNTSVTYYSDGTLVASGTGALGSPSFDYEESKAFYNIAAPVKRVIVEEGITEIYNETLRAPYPTPVELPDSLEIIGDYSLLFANPLEIKWPKNLKVIGANSLGQIRGIGSIYLPDSLERIGNGSFFGVLCENEREAREGYPWTENYVVNLVIPEKVERIG